MGFRSECFWLDMGNPADYARAAEAFEANRAAFLKDEGGWPPPPPAD